MKGARMVTVAIPDVDACETNLRYHAGQMCRGIDVMTIDLNPIIPNEVKRQLFDKLNEVVRDMAGQCRHHLDKNVTASLVRS
jgi:hypothetical protein